MAQLSRPYQIGLAAVAVLAAAWLLLIQGHHETSTGSSSSAPSASHVSSTPAHTTSAPSVKKAEGNAGTATGGGSASSIGGLGHAIEKAHGAVATSKADEHKLAEKSAQASSPTSSSSSSSETKATTPTTSAAKAPTTSAKKTTAPTHTAAKAPSSTKSTTPGAAHRNTSTVRQHTVEAQLAQGKIAVILFWDPKGADDRSVHAALRSLRGEKGLKLAIDEAAASQVASFGSITRGVQVYGTPTILIVNKKGRAMTLTGLQDSYAIAQAIREVRSSSS